MPCLEHGPRLPLLPSLPGLALPVMPARRCLLGCLALGLMLHLGWRYVAPDAAQRG